MGIVVISDEALKRELCGEGNDFKGISWVSTIEEVPADANLVADMLFENTTERLAVLKNLEADTVIINSVTHTLAETNQAFVRINGWPTFLQSALIEASGDTTKRNAVSDFFQQFGKSAEWVKDEPGFITPRVVSMIINEAYFALSENVSSKEDINTAMKLGTNYPFGPFEWAERIGVERIYHLLEKLSKTNPRYIPASGLTPSR